MGAWGVLKIVGSSRPKDRERDALAFQSNLENRVMIISAAGGMGIDLFGTNGIECSNLVFSELEWRPSDIDQAAGRLHRLGQHLAVTAWLFGAIGTIDDYMIQRLTEKDAIISQVVGDHSIVAEIIDQWR